MPKVYVGQRALGVEVCGGQVEVLHRRGLPVVCKACGYRYPERTPSIYPEVHDPAPPYSTEWAAVGDLVAELQARGLRVWLCQIGPEEYRAAFLGPGVVFDALLDAYAKQPLVALCRAALKALAEATPAPRAPIGGEEAP